MIKDFFIKKENIFIIILAIISVFFIILGFLFLFLKTDTKGGPRIIPNNISEIVWKDFSSKIIGQKIKYPEYMYISEQKESSGVGVNISDSNFSEFLTYFSNQNNFSIYPSGIDNQFFYGKTKKSNYKDIKGNEFNKIEYLTVDNKVWAIMLIPLKTPSKWQSKGFIWIQSGIKNKEDLCLSSKGTLIDDKVCDPYSGKNPVYKGDVSEKFIQYGYEIINKNSF